MEKTKVRRVIRRKSVFPTFWVIVLVLSLAWFAGEIGWLRFNFPWLPAIMILIAIGAIINHSLE